MANKFALLIGSREFEDPSLAGLSAPWEDVESLGAALTEFGGFTVDKQADLNMDDIRAKIGLHFQKAGPDDTLLLYYTGHGLRDTHSHDLYLALRRTQTGLISATSLEARFIREQMQRCASKRQILIYDCCHAGAAMGDGQKRQKGAPTLSEVDVLDQGGTGQYVLASSAAEESSYERNGKSIYTQFMVEALRTGAAAPDKAQVTVDDLHNYLVRRVGADEASMRPKIWKSGGTSQLVIARNPDPRKPVPKELVEALFGSDSLRTLGAITKLAELRDGSDSRLTRDVEAIFSERLAKTDDLLASVADAIRNTKNRTPAAVQISKMKEKFDATQTELDASVTRQADLEKANSKLDAANNEIQLQNADLKKKKGLNPYLVSGAFVAAAFGAVTFYQGAVGEYKDDLANWSAVDRVLADKLEIEPTDLEQLSAKLDAGLSAQEELNEVRATNATIETEKNDLAKKLAAQTRASQIAESALREAEAKIASLEAVVASAKENTPSKPQPLSKLEPDCAGCPSMIVNPGGTFMMGSPDGQGDSDEHPQTDVTIVSFALAETEVTFQQWQACVDSGGCKSTPSPDDQGWEGTDRPVINVSWNDAMEYIEWLNQQVKDGDPYRLPSEAEWEYAARATRVDGVPGPTVFSDGDLSIRASTTAYSWGSGWDASFANGDKTVGKTSPVKSYPANGFGLYDMHGNVWEWTSDCWHENLKDISKDGTAWATEGDCSRRVVRGGSWGSNPQNLRSANRYGDEPDIRGDILGFRPARTLLPLSP